VCHLLLRSFPVLIAHKGMTCECRLTPPLRHAGPSVFESARRAQPALPCSGLVARSFCRELLNIDISCL
jgi:hypothetical protein